MWISAVAASVLSVVGLGIWCDRYQVFPGRRLLGAFRRLPWPVQFFLLAFSLHLIVHGSIKTNAVGEVEGAAQQRGRDIPVACNKAASAFFSRDRNVASPLYEIPQPEAGRVPANAELTQNWWRRGCWEDWRTVTFEDGWVFPHGSNHLSQVVVMSQGEILAGVWDTLPLASLGARVALVPFDTCFYHEHTPSNSYRFVWDRAYIERNTNMPMCATIEFFRNGDYTISTNDCVTEQFVREPPFPHVGIGQDDDWVRANFTNAADILSVGYANWVDAQVGVDLTNGLYKFTATFLDDPPEATELIVGDHSVCVTNAGEYVFVLEKGVEYDFGTNPYDATVEYSMQDDLMDAPVFANWWWGDDNGVWTVDGDWHELYLPWLTYLGSCYWEPKFRGAPDVTNLSTADFPMTFTALLTDCCHTNGVTYHWTTDDEKVYIASPYSQTTQVEIDSCFDAETFSLSVEAYAPDRTYYSTLTSDISTNDLSGLSFSMTAPEVVFLNDDDRTSRWYLVTFELSSSVATNATVSFMHSGNTEIAYSSDSSGDTPLMPVDIRLQVSDGCSKSAYHCYFACKKIGSGMFDAVCTMPGGKVLSSSRHYRAIEPLQKAICIDDTPDGRCYNPFWQ